MILVLNCGSQSIKWKLFDEKLKVVKRGNREVLDSVNFEKDLADELSKISEDISLMGHRVVHGKDIFREPIEITDENLAELEKLNYLAPLHNPFNVLGIKACKGTFSGVKNIAVFDTEFFKDLSETAITYALPEEITKEFGYRRYGFHGISHEYVAKKAAEKIKKPFNKLKIITCHLGGGSSIAAIKNGKSVDTSMGFSPLTGAVMMTRPGDIDDEIIFQMVEKFGVKKTREILNKESGVKGVCGESEMLEVLSKLKNGNAKAKLAFDVFVYSVKKYIGAYYAVLGGCNVLVFTGAIGAGDPKTREAICKDLDILKNTKILPIETNEELAIAQKIINFK